MVNSNGTTALVWAAGAGHIEVARLLLEAGADEDMASTFGATALRCAAEEGHVAVARLLLEAGADKRKADNNAWRHSADSGSSIRPR